MSTDTTSTQEQRQDELRARLKQLAQRFSQAEIARRTGTSRNNVSRYLRGMRIPLDFGTAVVEGLDVNPTWLLTGEGASDLSELPDNTAGMAKDLLALVEAMNTVAHMRLGALTGKHHLRVLRELNDALVRYESLRESLNERTSSTFRDLIEQYGKAVAEMNYDKAEPLREALLQLSRMCDDENLQRAFFQKQVIHEAVSGDPYRAVELQRKVFQSLLPDASIADEESLVEASNFGLTLVRVGRIKEGRAVFSTTLAMARNLDVPEYVEARVLSGLGYANAMLGNPSIGLVEYMNGFSKHPVDRRDAVSAGLVLVNFLARGIDYEVAHALWPSPVKTQTMLRIAIWNESTDNLRHSVKHYSSGGITQPGSMYPRTARILLAILAGEDWRDEFKEALQGAPARSETYPVRLARHVHAAQLSLAAKDRKTAKAEYRKSAEMIASTPADITYDPLLLATHWRNGLRLNDAQAKKEFPALIRQMLDQGYEFVRPLAEEFPT
jgi:transcriptional regulator with XRE-family HTH domain